MTIIHIVEPFASGVALFVRSLTEAMPEDQHIVIHGERPEEVSAEVVKGRFNHSHIRFIRWRSATRAISPIKDFLAFIELYKILRRLKKMNRVDAVHLHSSKSGLLGRAACRMTGITNVFYTPNGASFLSAPNKLTAAIYKFFERIGNWLGGKVICSSRSEWNAYKAIGINAYFINNGTDLGQKIVLPEKKMGKTFKIVTSGRIEDQKNPALFNQIASYFADIPDIQFIWVGDGTQKNLLQSKNIQVTGWQSSTQVQEMVSGADLYLSTSKYEGLSFAVLEAMALKKPLLLSNCTGNSDNIKNGLNGDLFTGTQEAVVKILKYFNNKEMLKIMGEYSEEICFSDFDASKNYKAYRHYYTGSHPEFVNKKVWSFN